MSFLERLSQVCFVCGALLGLTFAGAVGDGWVLALVYTAGGALLGLVFYFVLLFVLMLLSVLFHSLVKPKSP